MKELYICGSEITEKEMLHELIAKELSFPEWYGNNLDALHDCLCDLAEPVVIRVKDFGALRDNLGGYADKLKKVLRASECENEKLSVEFEK